MGAIYQRGRIWWVSYYRGGKQYFETSRSKRKLDAKTLLQLREGDIAKGIPVTPKLHRVTWEDAVQDVLNDYTSNRKKSHAHVAKRLEKHLTPFFGGRRLSTISTADIRAYVAHRQAQTITSGTGETARSRTTANATINRELAILKRTFTLAMQAGKIMTRPHIPMLQEHNVRQGFFEREQFEAVRKRLPEELQGVALFGYLTGWRKQEILTLQWRQVDLKGGCVRLEPGTTKNGEGRTFFFTDELRMLLEQRKGENVVRDRIVPWVFHRQGEQIKSFHKAWQTACKGAGVPGRIFHDFRRTAVRNLVRAGVPERVAMQMTGHKTRSVFERYNVVSEGDLRNAADRLNRRSS